MFINIVMTINSIAITFQCSRLGIISVSDSLDEDISALAVNGSRVFAAAGKTVYAFHNGRQVGCSGQYWHCLNLVTLQDR